MPAQTDTFNECLVPNWGIETISSQSSITSEDIPVISFPKTAAMGLEVLKRYSSKERALAVISIPMM